MISVYNFIMMDDEQIEKFIKLYGEGDGNFSLARGLSEYAEKDARENENGEGLELRREDVNFFLQNQTSLKFCAFGPYKQKVEFPHHIFGFTTNQIKD